MYRHILFLTILISWQPGLQAGSRISCLSRTQNSQRVLLSENNLLGLILLSMQFLSPIIDQELFQRSADTTDNHGITLLMWASLHGHIDSVTKLLDLNVDVNVQTHTRSPKLRWESPNLSCHAHISLHPDTTPIVEKTTALMLAVQMNHPHIVKMLLDEGADLYQTDSDGLSAKDYAAEKPVIEKVIADFEAKCNRNIEESQISDNRPCD